MCVFLQGGISRNQIRVKPLLDFIFPNELGMKFSTRNRFPIIQVFIYRQISNIINNFVQTCLNKYIVLVLYKESIHSTHTSKRSKLLWIINLESIKENDGVSKPIPVTKFLSCAQTYRYLLKDNFCFNPSICICICNCMSM